MKKTRIKRVDDVVSLNIEGVYKLIVVWGFFFFKQKTAYEI